MLQHSTIQFLQSLQKNNNKPWFDENRKKYESAKENFAAFVDALIIGIEAFDPGIQNLTAKNCMFRINRDVRFSKDKSPYKTNMGASISKGGKKINLAGYYFHFEPGKSFAAGGFYMPMAPELAKIRQEIDYNFKEWTSIVESKNFKKHFPGGVEGIEILSRPPKGYEADNPAIEYLKMKGFIVSKPVSNDELMEKNTLKSVLKTFEAMKPMLDFLNRAVE